VFVAEERFRAGHSERLHAVDSHHGAQGIQQPIGPDVGERYAAGRRPSEDLHAGAQPLAQLVFSELLEAEEDFGLPARCRDEGSLARHDTGPLMAVYPAGHEACASDNAADARLQRTIVLPTAPGRRAAARPPCASARASAGLLPL